jgi:hypothetical protein
MVLISFLPRHIIDIEKLLFAQPSSSGFYWMFLYGVLDLDVILGHRNPIKVTS